VTPPESTEPRYDDAPRSSDASHDRAAPHGGDAPRDHDTHKRVIGRQRVYEGRIWDVMRESVELVPDQRVERDYVAHPGAVAIVAVDAKDRVVLVQQYRHPVRRELWEVPAGLLDVVGEDPLAAAQRELYEEADFYADQWEHLIDYYTTPGGSNEKLQVFLARGLRRVPAAERYARRDEEQHMEIRRVAIAEVVEMILAGGLMNPSTIVGVLTYWQKYGR